MLRISVLHITGSEFTATTISRAADGAPIFSFVKENTRGVSTDCDLGEALWRLALVGNVACQTFISSLVDHEVNWDTTCLGLNGFPDAYVIGKAAKDKQAVGVEILVGNVSDT